MLTAETFAIQEAIGQIAVAALAAHDTDKVIAVGLRVRHGVREFRDRNPDMVPRRADRGIFSLLGGDHAVPDFALAQHLISSADPGMMCLQRDAGDIDILLAYLLLMVCLENYPPVQIGLDEALAYATKRNTTALQVTRDRVRQLEPLAQHGEQMRKGRKQGTLGPVARKIRDYMKRNPLAKTNQVWEALARNPPKGHAFRDTPKLGRYIEKGAEQVMKFRRFQNLVSQHRPKKR